jgi:uncharacterized protein DUF5076
MAKGNDDPRIYQALALPAEALEHGGLEILRLGLIDDELYVSALPAFKEPALWGEVLAEVANRLGTIYGAQKSGLSKRDAIVQIAQAFAAEMGAQPVKAKPAKKPAKKAAKKVARKKR